MKSIIALLFVLSLISCDHFRAATTTTTARTERVDSSTVKKNINSIYDSMYMAFKIKNLNAMLSYLADDGKYLGTDPTEIWTKKDLGEYLSKAYADTAKIEYTITDRTIQTDEDGKSAIVVEQFYYPVMSRKMQLRTISRADYKDNRWLIDFFSWNLVPKNEDLKALNASLEKK